MAKIGRSIKIEPDFKICTKCEKELPKEEFRLDPTDKNPNRRKNQCNDCRNAQRRKHAKETNKYINEYAAMPDEERRVYIKKKSEQNQHRFKTSPTALAARKAYGKSDKGVYSMYKNECNRRGRKKRGIQMLLNFEEFSLLINNNCVYCGKENCRGVDRIDSDGNYTLDNAQPCCIICNQMKNSLTEEEFLGHMKQVLINKGII